MSNITLTIALSGPVATMAQSVPCEVNPSDWHADTLAAVFTYGARRWMQDHINSLAKARRDDGESVTEKWVNEVIAARLAAAVSGDITSRGQSTSDPMDSFRIKAVRAIMKTDAGAPIKKVHDAIPSDDQSARREFLLSVAVNNSDVIEPRAAALMAAAAKDAADAAKLAESIKL